MITTKNILKNFNSIKTLPHVALKLTTMLEDDTATKQEFEEVIKLDPTLVLRLFKLVNSSYYALRQKVETISEALVFAGMDNLRNMLILTALKEIFSKGSDGEYFSRNLLWLHCSAVSLCAQMISEQIFGNKGDHAFLCGILHDVGIIVEAQVIPDLFKDMCTTSTREKNLIEHETEIIGTDHCDIGFWLAREWKLPGAVQIGIRDHHIISKSIEPSSIAGIVQMAEYLTGKSGYGSGLVHKEDLSEPLLLHIKENLAEYKLITKELPEELERARDLYNIEEE